MEKILTPFQHLLFINLTSVVAVFGGLALWAGFIFLGLITRRFERAYGQPTHWFFHLIAPAGIVIYLVVQAVASWRHQNLGAVEQWIGYTLLLWSAGMCAWGVMRFRKVLRTLMWEG